MSSPWQPSATIAQLKKRAELLQKLRVFFIERDYLEVETPSLSRFGITDVYLSNIKAQFRGQTYYLQTSPEYHMKRLLAAGSGAIFQLAKVFRDDELGRWHNPEFTMLEWYQLNIDHHQLMDEVDELLQHILNCPAAIRKTYRQVFQEICQFDPFTETLQGMRACLAGYELDQVFSEEEATRDNYLFLLMSHVVEPALANHDRPVAVYDFPASQAALAQINEAGAADRFEFYFRGIELANGFHELTDAAAQHQRFQADLEERKQQGLEQLPIDSYFLAALEEGLPPCSGVALGVDRLIALALGQPALAGCLSFDFSRA